MTIAREFADLENDFNHIKDINTYVSTRYAEVWDCLPSLPEVDELIKLVESKDAADHAFFTTDTKEARLAKLKKLQTALKYDLGSR